MKIIPPRISIACPHSKRYITKLSLWERFLCVVNLFIRYSHASTKHMSPALNGTLAVRHFEHNNAIEISDSIIFDFYTRLFLSNSSIYMCACTYIYMKISNAS